MGSSSTKIVFMTYKYWLQPALKRMFRHASNGVVVELVSVDGDNEIYQGFRREIRMSRASENFFESGPYQEIDMATFNAKLIEIKEVIDVEVDQRI